MGIADKDIRPVSHGVIASIIFAAIGSAFTTYYEPARVYVSQQISLYWLLIAACVFVIVVIGLIQKIRKLGQQIRARDEEIADMKQAVTRKKRAVAQQNSRQIKQMDRSARNWLKW